MKRSFEIGGKYRNRLGEYEVVELKGDRMVIRYVDGTIQENSAKLQARILQNMQAEVQLRQARKERQARSRRQPQRAGQALCLHEVDFQEGVQGTSWRARSGLGGLLAQQMSELTRRDFQSYAVPRRPQVHVVQPERYDTGKRTREAKFILELDARRARYGFRVEKNSAQMDDSWDWKALLNALEGNEKLWQLMGAVMRSMGLRWQVCGEDSSNPDVLVIPSNGGLLWHSLDEKEHETLSWPDFIANLEGMERDEWCNLDLCVELDKEEAIAKGPELVKEVVEVYRALLPLYDASTQRD